MYFPLHPDTPPNGRSLGDLFARNRLNMQAMQTQMEDIMRAEGLPYSQRTNTYNSRLAQELAKWADDQSGFETIHHRIYQAYFVEDQNISDINVLVKLAKDVGLPENVARQVLLERRFSDAVDRDWDRSRRYGISGVPTFVIDLQRVVGAQPYEALEQLLTTAHIMPKTKLKEDV